MEKLSLKKLREKYAAESLSESEMEKINGGCADFSDVQSSVDSTEVINSQSPIELNESEPTLSTLFE